MVACNNLLLYFLLGREIYLFWLIDYVHAVSCLPHPYMYYYYYFINLAFCTLADLTPIFTHKVSHSKWAKVYGFIDHLLCFQKPLPSYTFTFFFTFSSSHHFYKPYLQSKTFFNIWAVPSSAVSSSNAVLITNPSSSMQFFSFFDVPKCPYWNELNASNVPHFFVSLFSSWYLSIFPFSFLLTLVSLGNIPQNLHFSIFNNIFWSMFILVRATVSQKSYLLDFDC